MHCRALQAIQFPEQGQGLLTRGIFILLMSRLYEKTPTTAAPPIDTMSAAIEVTDTVPRTRGAATGVLQSTLLPALRRLIYPIFWLQTFSASQLIRLRAIFG